MRKMKSAPSSSLAFGAQIAAGQRQLVCDMYSITDHEIELLAATGRDYYLSVQNFWNQWKDTPADRLSQRHAAWLSKIEEDLDDNWRPTWNEKEPEQYDF